MLAKVWKKILFAICIIACIYNVMSKIVNRHSLEENLKSANDGNVVFEFSQKKDNTDSTITTTNDLYLNETTETKEIQNEVVTENKITEENSSNQKSTKFFNFDFLF